MAVFKWTIFPHYSFRLKVFGSVVCRGGRDLQGLEFEWNNKCNQNSCVTCAKAMSRHSFTSLDVWSLLRLISFLFRFFQQGGYRSSSISSSLRVCWTNQTPKCWNFAFLFWTFSRIYFIVGPTAVKMERLQLVSWILCTKVESVNTVNSTLSRWSVTAGDLTSCRTQPKQTWTPTSCLRCLYD